MLARPSAACSRALWPILVLLHALIASAKQMKLQEQCRIRFPAPDRLVAVGDLHGDVNKARRALRAAGVLDPQGDQWVGGKTVVVQTGDQLDRGDDELEVLALLRKLSHQAEEAGGALHVLVGNHETLNAQGKIHYGTAGANERFAKWARTCEHKEDLPGSAAEGNSCELYTEPLGCAGDDAVCRAKVSRLRPSERARYLALRAGGSIAKNILSRERFAVLIVGDTLFVHGGLTVEHLVETGQTGTEALEKINAEVRSYLAGEWEGDSWPLHVGGKGVLWNRDFSYPGRSLGRRECHHLHRVFSKLPWTVRRMVVGHSVQSEVNAECSGAVWRVDVGMSRGVRDAAPQVLEIMADGRVEVLDEKTRASGRKRRRETGRAGGGPEDPLDSFMRMTPEDWFSVLVLLPLIVAANYAWDALARLAKMAQS